MNDRLDSKTIINRLKQTENCILEFATTICIFRKNYPYSMSNNQEVIDYILGTRWFHDGDLLVDNIYNSIPVNLHFKNNMMITQRSYLIRLIFSYLGTIHKDEEFWIQAVTREPFLHRYCINDDSKLLKSIAGIMS